MPAILTEINKGRLQKTKIKIAETHTDDRENWTEEIIGYYNIQKREP
jgi:hypothetical protein